MIISIAFLACNKECLRYNQKSLQIALLRNGENVSEDFKDQILLIGQGPEIINRKSTGWLLEYNPNSNAFQSTIRESCSEDSLTFEIRFNLMLADSFMTKQIIDTIDFEVSRIDAESDCRNCAIDNMISRKGNKVLIEETQITTECEI